MAPMVLINKIELNLRYCFSRFNETFNLSEPAELSELLIINLIEFLIKRTNERLDSTVRSQTDRSRFAQRG